MKIAIVVGHNPRAQGAVRVTDGITEYKWNSELAERIRKLDPASVHVFKRTAGSGEIRRVYAQVDEWGADCSVELHFNAFHDPAAHGGETLSSGTDGSMALCRAIQKRSIAALGNADRGVKVRTGKTRGAASLRAGRAPAALTEPYFGSNPRECDLAALGMDALARAVLDGCREFLGAGALPKPRPVAPINTGKPEAPGLLARILAAFFGRSRQ